MAKDDEEEAEDLSEQREDVDEPEVERTSRSEEELV